MLIQIDLTNGVPIFLQIVRQVKYKVAVGALMPGDQLPSVRQLAGDLRINPNTVAKSYTELERAGIIVTKRGAGCFVAEKTVIIEKEERLKIIAAHVDRALTEAFHLDIPLKEVETLFHQRMEHVKERSGQ
ncbi:MAG: GntR family transcriptional regulator [Candidatus Omnitrophota bacterium]|jgi:GntR family transcriptional regulator|nr:MAG: GntR family transcriptional regulator [Candidatus Omnitrophota bacterium]